MELEWVGDLCIALFLNYLDFVLSNCLLWRIVPWLYLRLLFLRMRSVDFLSGVFDFV